MALCICLQAGGAPTTWLVRESALGGFSAAPLAELEGKATSSETRDAFGRLVSFGLAEDPKVSAEGLGSAPTASTAAGPTASRAAGPTASSVTATRAAKGPPPGPLDGLSLTGLRYDEAGRVIEISRRSGGGDPDSVITRNFDSDGRLARIEFSRSGKVDSRLFLEWDGSGQGARVRLFDAQGNQKSFARLLQEGRGGSGLSVGIFLLGQADEDMGALSLAWDSAGRLSEWRVEVPVVAGVAAAAKDAAAPVAAVASATPTATATSSAKAAPDATALSAAKAAVTAGATAKEGAKPDTISEIGIPELLFPLWPGDAASMEAFAVVSGPFPHGDARTAFKALAASGFITLPYGRPPSPPAKSPEGSVAPKSASASSQAEGSSIDFLWDGSGRLLESHQRNASGQVLAFISCRYDGGGLLVEARSLAAPASIKAQEASAKPGAATEAKPGAATEARLPEARSFSYRLDAAGSWVEASVFLRQGAAETGFLKPEIYRERVKLP
ncbi:MAG: hypothetical protein WCQ50_01615 [Spirochaetota bacterium]